MKRLAKKHRKYYFRFFSGEWSAKRSSPEKIIGSYISASAKYLKALELGLQRSMEYRVNFLLGIVSFIFPLTIQFFLWTAVFDNASNKTVYGYTYSQMIIYTILAALISRLVSAGFEWEVADDIKNGGLNKYIIKPLGYYQYRISCFLGQKISHLFMIVLLIACVLVFFSIRFGFNVDPERILLFSITIIFAIVLNFTIVFCMSMLAFWLNEVWGAFVAFSLSVNIISGGLFPLEVFGNAALKIFGLLPFQYTIYFPINVINGKVDLINIVQGIAIQAVWIILLTFFAKFLWGTGIKKFVAIGG